MKTAAGHMPPRPASPRQNIHAAATANLANLAPYGVTAAKLTALKAKIDAYSARLSKPRDAVASGSTATKQMSDEFDAADAALNDQMDALVPQFIGKLPHDIIGGQPLHYRRTGDGKFLLYSVGWNETDDDGEPGTLSDPKQGDWVWKN